MNRILAALLIALVVIPVMAKTNKNDSAYTEKYSFEEKIKDQYNNGKNDINFDKNEYADYSSSNDHYTPTSPVPEPTSWMMMLAGGIIINRLRKKMHK